MEVLHWVDADQAAQLHGPEEPAEHNLDDLEGELLVSLGLVKVREIPPNTPLVDGAYA